MTTSLVNIQSNLKRRLKAAGFDLWASGSSDQIDRSRWPKEIRLPADRAVVLVGNSKALWKPFVTHLKNHPSWIEQEDPLDRYVEQTVAKALTESIGHQVHYAHTMNPAPVPMRYLGEVLGLVSVGRHELGVHPIYGPWVSLRAVIIFDAPPTERATPLKPHPCGDCSNSCAPAWSEVQRMQLQGACPMWPGWLKARDACPIGREYRFDGAQIEYHYRHDRAVLRREIRALA